MISAAPEMEWYTHWPPHDKTGGVMTATSIDAAGNNPHKLKLDGLTQAPSPHRQLRLPQLLAAADCL
jgi:hypothetical protein